MPPVPAGGPYSLVFSENGETSTRANDVLVGELWVQSGQSNMVKTVSSLTEHRANEILPDGEVNEIRLFINAGADSKTERRTDLSGEWKIADAGSVNGYSAVGYAALEEIYNNLNVPVGGICAGVGGTGMDGLKTTDGGAPKAFMVAGEDGKFYEAKAEITGKDTVKLTSSKVSDIKQVSYAVDQDIYPYTSVDDAVEQKYVAVNLVNSIDLPTAPFRFEVTKKVPAKTPIYAGEQIFKDTVEIGGKYSFPPTVELTKYDGTTERQRVTWTKKEIDTSKAGTYEVIGYPIKCDIPVVAKITVGDVAPSAEDILNEKGIILKLDYPTAIIKGKATQIDTNNKEVTPMLVNDRTMVPVRFIAEGYKAQVGWDDPTQTVTIELGGKTIKMVINALTYTVDGVEKTLDVPAQLINERTMVPVRVISEAFNKTVFWDGDRNLIVVYDGETLDMAKETKLLEKLNSKIAY